MQLLQRTKLHCSRCVSRNGLVCCLACTSGEEMLTGNHSNILSLPFRRTHSVSMSSAIKQYISTKYDQHPDMFVHDLEAIGKLRADAVNSLEAHTSGIKSLTAYAAQLVWIGGKFPIDVCSFFISYTLSESIWCI